MVDPIAEPDPSAVVDQVFAWDLAEIAGITMGLPSQSTSFGSSQTIERLSNCARAFLRCWKISPRAAHGVIPALRAWFAYCLTGEVRHQALMFIAWRIDGVVTPVGPDGALSDDTVWGVFGLDACRRRS